MMSKFSSSICPIFSSSVILLSIFSIFASIASSRGMAGFLTCAHEIAMPQTNSIASRNVFFIFS